MTNKRIPTALFILDGWGYREDTDNNAIAHAKTPFWDKIWQHQPHTLINTSGLAVGLPDGQMGNSEVGHMNLGAGRLIYQNFTRINKEIADGDFAKQPALTHAIDKAVASDKAIHVLGLLSPGGVHSHEDHIFELCRVAKLRGAKAVYIHAFLDGRDTPPRSAGSSLSKASRLMSELGCGRVASIVGRYFAMDRDNRWNRVQQAYDLLTLGKSDYNAQTPEQALAAAYERGEDDEFVKATRIQAKGQPDANISDGDSVIFMNFRPDRSRELTKAFVDKNFSSFERTVVPTLADFVMLTEYSADIKTTCAYPPTTLVNGMGEYLSNLGKTQLRIAETEKYAHVTFFFSGGQETRYKGEKRILVPSPDVATYDLKPEMSAPEVTDKLVEAIKSGRFDLIVCNYANGDMVGHTGNFDAAVKAAEALDQCLEKVTSALNEVGGQCLITADHGNAEMMLDENAQPHTQHTTGPVPLIYVGPKQISLKAGGGLCDVSPSLLSLMGLEKPSEMTGNSLVVPA